MAAKKPRKARVSTIPEGETKRQKFIRLGTARIGKTVKAIEQIGNLAGASYEYTAEDVTKIEKVLEDAVSLVMSRFQPKVKKEDDAPVITFA